VLGLLRRELRRGARNALITSLTFFVLSAWTTGLWAVTGLVGKQHPDREVKWIVGIAGLIALVSLPFVIRSVRAFRQPDLHAFFAAIHPDQANAEPERVGKIYFSPRLIAVPTFTGLDLVATRDVAWVYRKETKHTVHHVVTIAKTYDACIHTFDGLHAVLPIEVTDTEANVDRLLASVVGKAPWVKVGYDDSFNTKWGWKQTRPDVADPIRKLRDAILSAQH
jgi:hypothetical protein